MYIAFFSLARFAKRSGCQSQDGGVWNLLMVVGCLRRGWVHKIDWLAGGFWVGRYPISKNAGWMDGKIARGSPGCFVTTGGGIENGNSMSRCRRVSRTRISDDLTNLGFEGLGFFRMR